MNPNLGFSVRHLGSLGLSILAAIALFTASGCSQGGARSSFGGGDPLEGINDFNPSGGGTSLGDPSLGTGIEQPKPGSNSDGTFSNLDKTALNNAFNENARIAAPEGVKIFTPDLAAQAKEILNLARQKKETAIKRLLFMAAMLKRCGELVAKYTPLAGQTMLGDWNGQGACSVAFKVVGNGQGGKYQITGKYNGVLQADQQGKAVGQANPLSLTMVDAPRAAVGQAISKGFFVTKAGTSDCVVGIHLARSDNPIPKNYEEGMNVMGACLRQTVLYTSDIFDRMFQQMNPQLSQQLQSKFLEGL